MLVSRAPGLLCLFAVLSIAGCDAAQGGERQACYPNGTCNAGLTCASSVCVALGADAGLGGDAGASDTGASDTGATDSGPLDGGTADAWVDPCAGHISYAGMASGASSVWATLPNASGLTGLAAGNAQCASIGADHVCDYEEVVAAALAGELSAIPMGTTAWMQRTTAVDVGGTSYPAGQGGRCVDWTFSGNHLADGEYITFDALGMPTYHFDPDTFFDGTDTSHATPGDLECGGATRAILCCYPSCS